ncbi:MAG TPA: general secretion pathway protein GspC [Polyangiaceae bacterium]|nr:general secretion pathway protein GspC [Polyangiaceae bacterium]
MNVDRVIKRFFPVIVCVMIAVAAYFQASGVGELVASSIGEAPAPKPPAGRAPSLSRGPQKSAKPILARNPFDSVTGPLDSVTKPAAAPTDDQGEADVEGDPSSEDPSCGFGSVSIIMTADDPAWSFASITDKGGTSKLRRIGDPVDDYKIEAMGWDRVWLAKDSSRCQMKVRDDNAPKAAAKKPAAKKRPARRRRGAPQLPDELKNKITKVSDTEYNIERSVVDDILEKQAELMRYTRLKPVKDGDKVVGLRMSRIRSGTLLDVLGLKNGDQVQSINGFDLTDPQKALEAYGRLRTADRLTLKITRGGNPTTIDYNIQ